MSSIGRASEALPPSKATATELRFLSVQSYYTDPTSCLDGACSVTNDLCCDIRDIE